MKGAPPSLPDARLRAALEALASRVHDPAAKLWLIQRTLERYQRQPRLFRETTLVRDVVFHYLVTESFSLLVRRSGALGIGGSPRKLLVLFHLRAAVLLAAFAGCAYLGFAALRAGYPWAAAGAQWVAGLSAPLSAGSPAAPASSELLPHPPARAGLAPEKVWLVEKDSDRELWSNGLQIHTAYEARTERRSYYAFPRAGGPPVPGEGRPVGIVYHTSESDIAPFDPGFNQQIVRNTRGLLRWLRKRASYNYLIDRFGRVYRLVVDADVAGHAGRSIWADDDHFYLDLNDSFLGVCFESAWSPNLQGIEILTSAQIQAALNLTDMLRAAYEIPDANCVPHGLISVNPRRMLIGHHLDWARGFPFAALGLRDKYAVPLPSIAEFGFGYDEHLVSYMKGELWPGIELAEKELDRRAREEGLSVAALRRSLQQRYRAQADLLALLSAEAERAPRARRAVDRGN